MTTNTLCKMYNTLTATERGPLLLAAVARGDEVERQRVLDAATWKHWRVTDTYGFTVGVGLVFSDYVVMQWNHLAMHFFARTHWMYAEVLITADVELLKREFPDFDPDADDRLDLETCDFMADVSAYKFCVTETAWALFRDELRIGPDVLPMDDVLFEMAVKRLPNEAPSADELLARYPDRFPPHDDGTPFKPVTPADVCDGWRELLNKLVDQWE
ncbi:MAG: hypothetical protein HZA46_14025 [Planctomycetales bacterium]|nr:hypothetical protein [Planctomycetales bacterium]